MKKLTLITAILLSTSILFGQYKIDTSFFSEALQEEKMVDVYFPPGYDENPDLYYPVIYYLHGWTGDQNAMGTMLSWAQSLINNGTIDPVIMVGADNSPEPFEDPDFYYQLYETPFDLVVCSPRELDYLNDSGMDQYFNWVCPGIRDEWMARDHQERTTGVREALEKGAMWVVMATQILKGSPKNGISAEESRQRTLVEIQKFQA